MLTNFLEPFGEVNSASSKYKVDCGEGKLTWLIGALYSQLIGKGKIVLMKLNI